MAASARTAGVDWASEAHEVCVSEEGKASERFSVTHDERGIVELARLLHEAADVDSPISLAFLKRCPSPADAKGLGPKRLPGFLARQRYCGRRTPEELLERMRSAPVGRAGELETEARRAVVVGLRRAWIRVLWRCWQNRGPYDPARHRNFNRLQTAGG